MVKRTELHKLQAQYENYVALTTSRPTATRYAKALDAFFDRFTDREHPDEFSRRDIEDYKLFRRRDGVSNKTINYEIQITKSFFNWLFRQEIMTYNPCDDVPRLKETEPEKHALSEEQQLRLYETARATGRPLDYLLVSLALSTGLRAATLVQLELSDVDFEAGTLRLSGAKMKTRRAHAVPLREDVLEVLRTLPEGRLFRAKTAAALSSHFNRILARAGIPLRGLRLGRRTFATSLLRAGTDLGIVQTLLAHKNISTTSRYLVAADQEQVRAAVAKLPGPNPSRGPNESSGGL